MSLTGCHRDDAAAAAGSASASSVPASGASTARDGNETVYTLHPAGQPPIAFSTCEAQLDKTIEPFRSIEAAYGRDTSAVVSPGREPSAPVP